MDNNNKEIIEQNETKKIGKSKLQGFKNFFGAVDEDLQPKVENAKDALNSLYKEVKYEYKTLAPGNIEYKGQFGKKLDIALTSLKTLCDTAEAKENGTGREFGAWLFEDYQNLNQNKRTWNYFVTGTCLLLTLYSNCKKTSSIPYFALGSAATICEKFYVYVMAYCNMLQTKINLNQNNGQEDDRNEDKEQVLNSQIERIDTKLNNQMKKIGGKVTNSKKWKETKKQITDKAKTLGKVLLGGLTVTGWGPTFLIQKIYKWKTGRRLESLYDDFERFIGVL